MNTAYLLGLLVSPFSLLDIFLFLVMGLEISPWGELPLANAIHGGFTALSESVSMLTSSSGWQNCRAGERESGYFDQVLCNKTHL